MCDLGASAQMYGSLLADILDELPGKFSDKLAQLNVLVLEKYQELGVPASRRLPKLTRSRLYGQSKYPCLLHVKGRRVRYFADVALALSQMFNGSELGKHREAACEALQTMYNMTDLKQWVFDKKQFKKFDRCLDLFLLHYGFLAKQSYSAGQTKYSVVQKFHMLAHFGRQSKWMTPRTCWAMALKAS